MEAEAIALRDLMEDELYQPSTSSSSLPSPSSSSLSVAERNQAFLESLDTPQNERGRAREDVYIEEIDMFEGELVFMTTKDLNALMKRRNIPRERQKQIKERRRTLKNRGYAANCRVRRDDEEEELLEQIEGHERRLEELDEEERRRRMEKQELEAREREDREWEAAIKEYKDFIRPGELDRLLKLPGQK